jgi:hypothetical protein
MTQPTKLETDQQDKLDSQLDGIEVLESSANDSEELSELDLEAIAGGGLGDPGNRG